jgi:mevalonate kinase
LLKTLSDLKNIPPSVKNTFYPAKLLLFGEHTVLQGSQALAMPLPKFSGRWQFSADKTLQYNLADFNIYLKDLVEKGEIALNTDGVSQELSQGLHFKSNIPNGYGVGSSGALVAALYDVFCETQTEDLAELKTILGKMESFFHGASSGFDPLVCYIRKPILIKNDRSLAVLEEVKNDAHVFLLDTGIPRKGEHMIRLFTEKSQNPAFKDLIINDLLPNIDEAITCFLQNQPSLLFETLHKISLFQYRYFPEAVPLSHKNVWLEGLNSEVYKLKLCGSGGGGFILGFCLDVKEAKKMLAKSGFKMVLI